MPPFRPQLDRRQLLLASAAALAPSVARSQTAPPEPTDLPPSLAGSNLRLLTWQRPMDGFNDAYESLLRTWADSHGVGLTIDWMFQETMVDAVMNEISLGHGHDLIDSPQPMPQAEPAMQDLSSSMEELIGTYGQAVPACDGSTMNPVTGVRWGIAWGWEPSIAIYRASLWQEAGYPFGPMTTDELLLGATWIWNERGAQLGLGLTSTWDSEVAAQSLVWAGGGAVQDPEDQVVLAGDGTLNALTLMRDLFHQATTPVVLEWDDGDNVEFMLNGFGSYTIAGLHDLRSIARAKPEIAADLLIAAPPAGPDQPARAMALTMPTLMIPTWNTAPEPAMALLRELVAQSPAMATASQLAYLPAFPAVMPNLFGAEGQLANDPFDTTIPTRLAPLAQAPAWTVSAGWPGSLNPMIEEGHRQGLLVTMLAEAATSALPDVDAMRLAADAFDLLAAPWQASGLMRPQSTPGGVG